MDELKLLLKNKKQRLNLILLAALILFLPIGIYLVKQTQIFFPKALEHFVELAEGQCVTVRNGQKVLICTDVPLKLVNPFIVASSTSTPTPSNDSTPSPSGVTGTTDTSYDMGVLVLKYFPVTADNKIDITITGDVGEPYDTIHQRTIDVTTNLLSFIPKATSYLGYKNSSAKSAITPKIIDTKEYKQVVPIKGKTGRPTYPDYNKIMTDNSICDYVDNKGVSYVFLWAYQGPNKPDTGQPYLGIDESKMSGPNGDISNSERLGDMPKCTKTYRVFTFNYGRGTAEAIESWSHQIEAEISEIDTDLFRNKWQGSNYPQTLNVNGRCGSAHNPPNARSEYDRGNPAPQKSDCLEWNPGGIGTLSDISCLNWGCSEVSDSNNPSLNYMVWNWQNLPGRGNTKTYQGKKLRNLWDIHGNFDKIMSSDKTIFLPTQPVTSNPTTTPTSVGSVSPGAVVRVVGNTGTAIQAALDSVKTNGGSVYVPAGTYTVSEKIRLFNNTTLFGDGPGQTILQATQAIVDRTEPIMSNDSKIGQRNVTVRDMTIKGLGTESNQNRCCPGLRYADVDGGYIINMEVLNFSWVGIYLGYHDGKGVKNVRVTGCKSNNNKGSGVAIALGENNVIDNCEFIGNNNTSDPGKKDAALNLEIGVEGGIKNNKVLNNRVSSSGNAGISLKADPTFEVSNNAVCNNTSENNSDVGIADAGGNGNIYIANRINNNHDRNDGKIVICDQSEISKGVCDNLSRNIFENESSGATNVACNIPSNLNTLPVAPVKPSALIPSFLQNLNPLYLLKFVGTVFAENNNNNCPGGAVNDNDPCLTSTPTPTSGNNAPAAPTAVTATALTTCNALKAQIKISWTNPTGAQWHKIERTTDGTTWGTVGFTDGNAPLVAEFIDTSPAPSTWYAYRVSVAVSGSSTLSAVTNSNWIKSLSCAGDVTAAPTATSSGTQSDTECNDTEDNDGDGFADIDDPQCHTDGNAGNEKSYDPKIKFESYSYRLSETEADLETSDWLNFDSGEGNFIVTNFTLSDDSIGPKQVWVEFRSLSGELKKDHITINLSEKDPEITGLNCTLDLAKEDIKVSIKGKRFGKDQGSIVLGYNLLDTDLKSGKKSDIDTLEWTPESITFLQKKGSLTQVTDQLLKVVIIRTDDAKSQIISCGVDQSLIYLGARVFCREPGKFDVPDVKVTIYYNADDTAKGATTPKKTEEKVTIDKDGVINGLKTKLQVGKNYAISIKAPYSLRRNATFTASEGTTVINTDQGESFILPVGDIAPVNLQDGKINGLDRSELSRQWRVLGTNTKSLTGDFNRDTKVNSIDWACMRYDFDAEDDPLPTSVPESSNAQSGQDTRVFSIPAN